MCTCIIIVHGITDMHSCMCMHIVQAIQVSVDYCISVVPSIENIQWSIDLVINTDDCVIVFRFLLILPILMSSLNMRVTPEWSLTLWME